jgi:hypothetical protein
LSINAAKPIQSAIMRRTITDKQQDAEKRYAQEKLRVSPETVSSTSSTHAIFGEVGVDEEAKSASADSVDMMAGMKHDVVCGPHILYSRISD